VPGDPERAYRRQRNADGIVVDATTWAQLLAAGAKLGLEAADLIAIAGPR
jgi:uncharacterized oxidoreductase